MESLRVALGSRSYPIHIGAGLIGRAELYRDYLSGGSAAIVTNDVVGPLYLEEVKKALRGARVTEIVVPDGEQAKGWETLQRVFDALLAARCGRDTLLVALGGGVVGDLAGFAAAVYQRGIDFVQVPTTLLAHVDSSVGGKTAINHPRGKNMIGAFHQPRAVIADLATLDSLPERELRAGIAEVIKHGLALDADFFQWLEQNIDKLLARDRGALAHAVRRSCELKAAIVAADEREAGARALLNLGHTFGHAIEAGTGYGTWLHGEAVAAGMVMAAELSLRLGSIDGKDVLRIRQLVSRAGLPVKAPPLRPEELVALMSVDKKAAKGVTRFVVLDRIGAARLRADVEENAVRAAIVAAAQ
jgi:3-dehydroquinate synthase